LIGVKIVRGAKAPALPEGDQKGGKKNDSIHFGREAKKGKMLFLQGYDGK